MAQVLQRDAKKLQAFDTAVQSNSNHQFYDSFLRYSVTIKYAFQAVQLSISPSIPTYYQYSLNAFEIINTRCFSRITAID